MRIEALGLVQKTSFCTQVLPISKLCFLGTLHIYTDKRAKTPRAEGIAAYTVHFASKTFEITLGNIFYNMATP